MSYVDTFIAISTDCPVSRGEVPSARGGKKTIPQIQYEVLSAQPYRLTERELIFEVHVRHKEISAQDLVSHRDSIWAELFRKPHPCMRASMLPKRFGWGVHYDREGRIAIFSADSPEYKKLRKGEGGVQVVPAMRNKRA